MNRKQIISGEQRLLYGGDYNPEQWLEYPEILEKDIEMMKKAHVNVVTLGVFSWSIYEPEEGKWDFSWLDQVIERLWANQISVILATPTGARPAWLDQKYPEVMRVNAQGRRNHHGFRHNHCMSSDVYRKKARILNGMLAQRYGEHPGLLMWHISNEYSGECFCKTCQKKFRSYLEKKYGTVENLNRQWWNTFWSHNYQSFEQIEAPTEEGEAHLPMLNVEWKKFTTENTADFMREEIRAIREFEKKKPVTTNFMWMFHGLDYRVLAKDIDFVSWDAYPQWHNDYESLSDTGAWTAFNHSIMRSMKPNRPFILMESTPSRANGWRPNKLKRPGITKLTAMQAIACGSDSVLYFQWRKGRGGYEQYHGAVVDHDGRDDTRIFQEVADTGEMLEQLREVQGSIVDAPVGILYEWSNLWALEQEPSAYADKQYDQSCFSWYQALLQLGIDADVIDAEADFSRYPLLIMPMYYSCSEALGEKLRAYTAAGGCLVGTYLSAYVNETLLCHLGGFPGAKLKEVFGIRAAELDYLYPTDRNGIQWNGKNYEVKDCCEILALEGAKVLAEYTTDFYGKTAAVTENRYGQGRAIYVACRTGVAFQQALLRWLCHEQGIPFMEELPAGVEHHVRHNAEMEWHFYLNFSDQCQTVDGEDILPGNTMIKRQRCYEN